MEDVSPAAEAARHPWRPAQGLGPSRQKAARSAAAGRGRLAWPLARRSPASAAASAELPVRATGRGRGRRRRERLAEAEHQVADVRQGVDT